MRRHPWRARRHHRWMWRRHVAGPRRVREVRAGRPGVGRRPLPVVGSAPVLGVLLPRERRRRHVAGPRRVREVRAGRPGVGRRPLPVVGSAPVLGVLLPRERPIVMRMATSVMLRKSLSLFFLLPCTYSCHPTRYPHHALTSLFTGRVALMPVMCMLRMMIALSTVVSADGSWGRRGPVEERVNRAPRGVAAVLGRHGCSAARARLAPAVVCGLASLQLGS